MSQQVPFDNSSVPQDGTGNVAGAGYVPQQYDSQYANAQYEIPPGYDSQGGYMQPMEQSAVGQSNDGYSGGGYGPPPRGSQMYERNRVPMIDPIESAKLTPQLMLLLVISGLKRHWKWGVPMGMVLGLFVSGTIYLLSPLQYSSEATLQIRAVRESFLTEARAQQRYDEFVNTQRMLIQSPAVVDRALENADVMRLPIIVRQNDRRGWIQKNLRAAPQGRSEIFLVGISTESPEASETIVNAVVESYFKYIDEVAKENASRLLAELQVERRKQIQSAQTLQDQIRASAAEAAQGGAQAGQAGFATGLGINESLMRDAALADAQLTKMRAEEKAILNRIDHPERIPLTIILQMSPELQNYNQQREALMQRRNEILLTFTDPQHARVQEIDREIDALDANVKRITGEADGGTAILAAVRRQQELELYNLRENIRVQDTYVLELNNKYQQQLSRSTTSTGNVIDVTFQQTQLERTNRILQQIEDRILAIQSEQRAPGHINWLARAVRSEPDRIRQIMMVGMGGVLFTFFPLLLGIAIERMKPRLYHVSQVRRSIPQVLIGEIMEPPTSWIHGQSFRKRMVRYQESVHNWCTHLLLSDPFRTCRTISVASVAGDDGKTFLAVQIAVAMAQMKTDGPVLLIDGDMRVGRLHLLFGNEETGLGLADVLSHRVGAGAVITESEKDPNLSLISAGQLDTSPYELLGDGRFKDLLDTYLQRFSLIIVVLPPVANAGESLIMAQSTDSTLLCVRQRETVLGAMEDVYRRLVNTGASVDGIVVKDIPYYQMAGRDGGFSDKLEQVRLSHLLQYTD